MVNNESQNKPSWYVIHTNPRQEERCEANLNAWHVETFNPKFRDRQYNQFTGKPTFIIKSLFPRYIFARFSVDECIQQIRFTRGVHSVVSFGDGPTPVDDEIINIIKARVGADGFVRTGSDLKPGDKVAIGNGALKGFMGVFEREIEEGNRIMILLTAVSYQAHVVMEREAVKRVQQAAVAK